MADVYPNWFRPYESVEVQGSAFGEEVLRTRCNSTNGRQRPCSRTRAHDTVTPELVRIAPAPKRRTA